jgi:hypothetical protein
VLAVQVFEERHAPAAASARVEALADERCDRRVFAVEVRLDFAKRDSVAQAHMVVLVHACIVLLRLHRRDVLEYLDHALGLGFVRNKVGYGFDVVVRVCGAGKKPDLFADLKIARCISNSYEPV